MNAIVETQTRLIASPGAWLEGEAVRQFHAAARLEGVCQAVGFPGLHSGRGAPVGGVFVTDGVIYPHLIGGDIGCGMALWKTSLKCCDANPDRWGELRFDLEHPWEGNARERLARKGLISTQFTEVFGTLGGGSHFAELQAVEQVFDNEVFQALGLSRDELVMLVHSGSRDVGQAALETHLEARGANGAPAASSEAGHYLLLHDHAVRWARANRELLARRLLETLGAEGERVWDGCHNSLTCAPLPLTRPSGALPLAWGGRWGERTPEPPPNFSEARQAGEAVYIHRRGAVAADGGPVVIAGSRGAFSYLVQPAGDGDRHAWSLPHGAGRKWSRSESRQRVRERLPARELVRTPLGGRVVCEQRDLLYEEAPMVFKPIESVIEALHDAGLVAVIATLRPVFTYKTRAQRH